MQKATVFDIVPVQLYRAFKSYLAMRALLLRNEALESD
jgi:hypothetical protein